MDIQPRVTSYTFDNNGWLDSREGTGSTVPITLDFTAFNAAQYAGGFIPSGCALGVITATGAYGPYDDTAADGRQTAVGFLFGGVRVATGATKAGGALLRRGDIKTNHLPFQSGQAGRGYIDANGQADLAAKFTFRSA